jgi:hypothetical protein
MFKQEDMLMMFLFAGLLVAGYYLPDYSTFLTHSVAGRVITLGVLFVLADRHKIWALFGFIAWVILWAISKGYIGSSQQVTDTMEEARHSIMEKKFGSGVLDIQLAKTGVPVMKPMFAPAPSVRLFPQVY